MTRVIHRGTLLGALGLGACSFQNFDSLSSGGTGSLGASGSAGASGTGGAAGDGGSSGTAGSSGAGGTGSGGSGTGAGGAPNDAGVTGNLFVDPGFELAGHVAWKQFGTTKLSDKVGEGRNGTNCILSENRIESYAGPSTTIAPPLTEAGQVYRLEGWVRALAGAPSVNMTVKELCVGVAEEDATYTVISTQLVNATDFTLLSGEITVPTCPLTEYRVYFEGPPAGDSFYLDDVGLYPVQ